MKHSFLIAVVILAFSTAAYGSIKCYVCDESTGETCSKSALEDNKAKYLKDCGSDSTQCLRVWAKGNDKTAIANSCSNALGCTLAKKLCETAEEHDDDVTCKVGCCDTDACNAATPVSFSLFLMTVCSVFGLIFLK